MKGVWLSSCPSTNDVAWEEGRLAGRDLFVVAADAQTAGRGRQGRSWTSPAGKDLLFSAYLRPGKLLAPAGVVTAIGAVALCEALVGARHAVPLAVQIWWPNDLYIGGRKLCGILAESRSDLGTPDYVLGIGLNVNSQETDWPPEIRARATSILRETGRETDRKALLEKIIDRIALCYAQARAGDTEPLRNAWKSRSGLRGRKVRLHMADRTLEGTVESADFADGIALRPADGARRLFQAEHVTLLEPL